MLKNYVLETASAPGTSAGVTLAGPPAGRVSFVSQFGASATCFYFATDDTQAEAGICTITAGTPDTLTRPGSVLWNTAGTTSRLNFTGAVRFYNAVPAENMLYRDGSGIVSVGGKLANVAAGVFGGDAPRVDQVGRLLISSLTGAMSSAIFALPAGFSDFRIEWWDAAPVTTASLVAQFSTDGGSTYFNGGTDYSWFCSRLTPGASANDSGSNGYVRFAPQQTNVSLHNGHFEFTQATTTIGSFDDCGLISGAMARCIGGMRGAGFSGPLTNVKLTTDTGATFGSMRARLYGGLT